MSKSVKTIHEYEGYHQFKVKGIGKGYVFQSDTDPYDIILVRSQDSAGSVNGKLTSNIDEIFLALGKRRFKLKLHLFGKNTNGFMDAGVRYVETHRSNLSVLAFVQHFE